MAKKLLDDWKRRRDALEIIRNTGVFAAAWKYLGITERTAQLYRETHPEFEQACLDAKLYFQTLQHIQRGGKLRQKALEELEKRIEDGSLSDTALLKILYDTEKHG